MAIWFIMNHLVDLYDDWLLHLWSFLFRNALQILRGSPDNPWENSPGFSKILRDCLGLSRTFFFPDRETGSKETKRSNAGKIFPWRDSLLSLSLSLFFNFFLSLFRLHGVRERVLKDRSNKSRGIQLLRRKSSDSQSILGIYKSIYSLLFWFLF